ncbi:MAG: Gfo/Idh/MocA family oxidoreductase, partial [Candidatus Latescibacteria bacterium]|nr:Gfo/Idh/MocA family oxidoreductase [Candidatus Latescibacterota bacterium]
MGTQVPKVAVIGTGRRALDGYIKVLLEQFSERIKIVAVTDRVSERLDEARQILGPEVKLFSDYQELLSSTDVDAVIICTPDFTHEQINLDCLKADKHVICEKPLALSLKGCERVIQEAETKGKLLQVGLVLRYSPFHQRLKEVVENGAIGRVHLISVLDYYAGGRTYFRRWNRLRKNSGGLLIHKGCHAFD